jgi:hypothetical protein
MRRVETETANNLDSISAEDFLGVVEYTDSQNEDDVCQKYISIDKDDSDDYIYRH